MRQCCFAELHYGISIAKRRRHGIRSNRCLRGAFHARVFYARRDAFRSTRTPGFKVAHSNLAVLVNTNGTSVASFVMTGAADVEKLRRSSTPKSFCGVPNSLFSAETRSDMHVQPTVGISRALVSSEILRRSALIRSATDYHSNLQTDSSQCQKCSAYTRTDWTSAEKELSGSDLS